MSDAAAKDMHALGKCDGRQLWLSAMSREECTEFNRLLIRTASNSYFPQLLSVISLPEKDDELINRVHHLWTFLQHVNDAAFLENLRANIPLVKQSLEGFGNEMVLEEIRRRKGETSATAKSVKQAELETLSAVKDEIGEDKPDGPFFARALPKSQWMPTGTNPWMKDIERIVLIHRLRRGTGIDGIHTFRGRVPRRVGRVGH